MRYDGLSFQALESSKRACVCLHFLAVNFAERGKISLSMLSEIQKSLKVLWSSLPSVKLFFNVHLFGKLYAISQKTVTSNSLTLNFREPFNFVRCHARYL